MCWQKIKRKPHVGSRRLFSVYFLKNPWPPYSQHQNHLKNILRKLSRNCLKYNIYILDRSTAYYIYYKYRSFIGILKFRLHKKNWKLVTRYLLYIWCLPIFGNLNVLQWHFSSTVFAYKIISNNLGGNFEAFFFSSNIFSADRCTF